MIEARLVDRLSSLPIFRFLGGPIDTDNPRIFSWSQWIGPDSDQVQAIHLRQQDLHDQIVTSREAPVWYAALNSAVDCLAPLVDYDAESDAWHAPTTAVWSAAWAFAVEEAHRAAGLDLPDDLASQIYWYERGHWPCALAANHAGNSVAAYVIY